MGLGKSYMVEETEFLRTHYLEMLDEELSMRLNRPVGSIKKKRERLGLLRFYQEPVAAIAGESWKPLLNHPEYFISDRGRVRTNSGLVKTYANDRRVQLTIRRRDRQFVTYNLSRLVALLFCNPPLNWVEMDVHHIDLNSMNNSDYNLEWLSEKDHQRKHGYNV